MFETLLDNIGQMSGAILSGGATGIFGTALSGVIDYFQTRQRHQQEMDLRRLDIELARTEAAGAERVAAIEAESERDQAAANALAESYRASTRRLTAPGEKGLMLLMDAFRAFTRPGLTWTHVILVALIFFFFTSNALGADSLKVAIVQTVLFVYTASSLWWFGQRQISKGHRQ